VLCNDLTFQVLETQGGFPKCPNSMAQLVSGSFEDDYNHHNDKLQPTAADASGASAAGLKLTGLLALWVAAVFRLKLVAAVLLVLLLPLL